MKVILTLGNFEDQFGGIQWYVDQLLGSGHDKEEFYTNSQAKDAYRNYVSHIVQRTNSINGIQYRSDTTILSWELLVSRLLLKSPTLQVVRPRPSPFCSPLHLPPPPLGPSPPLFPLCPFLPAPFPFHACPA